MCLQFEEGISWNLFSAWGQMWTERLFGFGDLEPKL